MKKLIANAFLFITPVLLPMLSFNFPFVFWPEMLNWPFIMSHGWLPYRDFSIIHTPILPVVLMFYYRLVGFSPMALRTFGALCLFFTNLVLVLLVWRLTKNRLLALVVGILHGVLSLAFEGNTVWFESLLTPMLLASFWFQIDFLSKPKLWKILLSGIFMGTALLTKQTALFLLPEFFVFLCYLNKYRRFDWINLARITFTFFIPIITLGLVFLFFLLALNIFPDFINWSVKFVFLWTSLNDAEVPSAIVLPTLRQSLMLLTFLLITGFLVWRQKTFIALFLGLWTLLAFLFIIPRFEYFHLLVMLPFFILLIALGFMKSKLLFGMIILLVLLIFAFPVLRNTYLISQRFFNNEVIEISEWLNREQPNKSIFSLNGPDLVYFLTQRPPAVKPWVDQLPWEMAFAGESFTNAFKRSRPQLVVFRPYLEKPVNGLGTYQPKEIVKYVSDNYHLIKSFSGGVQILSRND